MFALWVFAFPLIRQRLGLDDLDAIAVVGIGLAILTGTGALVNLVLLPWQARRLRLGWAHSVNLLVGVGGFMLLASAGSREMLFLGYAIIGVGWASISNIPYQFVSNRVTDGRYTSAMAWFNLTVAGPQIALATGLSWLVRHISPMDAMAGGALALVVAAALAPALNRQANSASAS